MHLSRSHRRLMNWLLSLFVAFIFVQSLFFKFTDSPETLYIFGTLETWAASLGATGWFAPDGIFSAYVVGSAELLASVLLLLGLITQNIWMHRAGAALAWCVISGAIFFHLFTPLGVAVRNTDGSLDGGALFFSACGVWLSCLVLLWNSRHAR
jgi:uncharacterized membrane protein YphA (DoxX/SURF4 family)